ETLAAIRLEHEHVAQVAERGAVGDDARETDLAALMEEPEAERVLDRLRHDLARDPFRPVAGGEETVHHVQVHARGVGRDGVLAARPLACHCPLLPPNSATRGVLHAPRRHARERGSYFLVVSAGAGTGAVPPSFLR